MRDFHIKFIYLYILLLGYFAGCQPTNILNPYQNTYININHDNPLKIFEFYTKFSDGDLVLHFEIGNGFTVQGLIFLVETYKTCIIQNNCPKETFENEVIKFHLHEKDVIIRASEIVKKFPNYLEGIKLYIAFFDNKYSYEDNFSIYTEKDIINLEEGEPKFMNRFLSLGKYTFQFISNINETYNYKLQVSSNYNNTIRLYDFNDKEIYLSTNKIIDYTFSLEYNKTYYIDVTEGMKKEENMFLIMITKIHKESIRKIEENQIILTKFILLNTYNFIFNISHYSPNEENFLLLTKNSANFDVKIGTKNIDSLHKINQISPKEVNYSGIIMKETDIFDQNITNYYIKIRKDNTDKNEYIFIQVEILSKHTNRISLNEFSLKAPTRIENKIIAQSIQSDYWIENRIPPEKNKNFPIFIKYHITQNYNIIIHSKVENLITIIRDTSEIIDNVDNLAIINPSSDGNFSFILKINNIFYANDLMYSFFITKFFLRVIETKNDLISIKYCFNCFKDKFYLIMYDNYLISHSHPKDSLFKRFQLHSISLSNKKERITKLKQLSNIYYENKKNDINNILLLKFESRETIMNNNNIKVEANQEKNGNIFITFNNEIFKNKYNEYVISFYREDVDDEGKDPEIVINDTKIINQNRFKYEIFDISPGKYIIQIAAYNTSTDNETIGVVFAPIHYLVQKREKKKVGKEEEIEQIETEERIKEIISIFLVCIALFLLIFIGVKYYHFLNVNEKLPTHKLKNENNINTKDYRPLSTQELEIHHSEK